MRPYQDRLKKLSGNIIVPESLIDDMQMYWTMPNVWTWMSRQSTWEERLARAIEERSICYRLRAFYRDWSDRLSTAWEVLRGRHYCGDD